MIYGTSEDRKNHIQKKINNKRDLVKYFPIIKKVVQSFDGKVYNVKLDRALSDATKENPDDRAGKVYCHIAYNDWIEICSYNAGESITWLYIRKDQLKDGKRIDAAVWLEDINKHYARLMKDITGLERDLETIDDTMEKIKILKDQIRALVAPLDYTTRDVYGISTITV